jgi:hypothetical protein
MLDASRLNRAIFRVQDNILAGLSFPERSCEGLISSLSHTFIFGKRLRWARAEFDRGEAMPDLSSNRMLLVERRSQQQETPGPASVNNVISKAKGEI